MEPVNTSALDDAVTKHLSLSDAGHAYAKAAGSAAGKLDKAENNLLNLLNSDNPSNNAVLKAQVEYQRALRFFEALSTLIKNVHETLMNVIRRMAVN